jgi:hypothetical protein
MTGTQQGPRRRATGGDGTSIGPAPQRAFLRPARELFGAFVVAAPAGAGRIVRDFTKGVLMAGTWKRGWMSACGLLATAASICVAHPDDTPAVVSATPADAGAALITPESFCDSPAGRGEVAACYDRTKPPSPEIQNLIEQQVLGALARYHQQGSRWPGSAGAPVTITWSFIPDGTMIGSGAGEPASASNLFATMNAQFGGNTAAWVSLFQQCFNRWAQLTGTSYVRVQFNGNQWDDGAAFGNGGATGAAGLRGDVRIGGHTIDGGSGILAYNYYPSFGGDMVLDTADTWNNATNNYIFLRNVVTHEHGHGMGLLHNCPANGTKLMEPFIFTGYDGPQHDDLRGIMNLYGDAYESNNSAATATNLGTLPAGGSFNPSAVPSPAPVNGSITAIDLDGDNDYFRCTLTAGNTITVTAAPIGLTYDNASQSGTCPTGSPFNSLIVAPLGVQIIASDGTTVLGTNNAAAGTTAVLNNVAVPAGNFYVRVYENGAPAESQLYNLTISAGTTPAPGNDTCANATPVTFGTITGTNEGALADGGDSCRGNTNKDVWYSITPPCTGTLLLDTCGSALDTVVSVHTACVGTSGNQIGCNDDNGGAGPCPGGLTSYLAVPVTGGTNYKIRVTGFGQATGTFTLNIGFAGPSNDDCANAIPVVPGGSYSGQTCGATNDGSATCGASAATKDVWYSYTPSCNHLLVLNTCGSNYDTVISVHSGACGNLTQVGCNDDAGSSGPCPNTLLSYLAVPVTAGVNYRIRVSGFAGNVGNYVLNVGAVQQSNDACANAPTVTTGVYTGGTCGATNDGSASCGASAGSPDVWYRWVAPCSGNLVLSTCGSAYDTVVSVHTGTCGNLVQVGCNDDAGVNGLCPFTLQSYLSVPVASGTAYYIRVSGYNSASGSYVLSISQQPNDDCASATPAVVGSNPFSTLCATNDGAFGACAASTTTPDVWFTYTPACNGTMTIDLCGSNYDTALSVLTGACGALTEAACNDDSGPNGPCPFTLQSYVSMQVSAGTTYRIRIAGFAGSTGSGTMTIGQSCGCDTDYTCDGNADQDDVTALVTAIASGDYSNLCLDPDFNGDGNADQDDITALINVIGGGACP